MNFVFTFDRFSIAQSQPWRIFSARVTRFLRQQRAAERRPVVRLATSRAKNRDARDACDTLDWEPFSDRPEAR
jgi:hypothetical protein